MLMKFGGIEAEVARYSSAFGARARAHLSFDLSRAIGSHDWDRAHLLQRAEDRLAEMQAEGHFDAIVGREVA